MRVLHLSTWKERCGIADFTASVVEGLTKSGVENEVVPLDASALCCATSGEFLAEMDRFAQKAAGFDLAHVQHEFSLFTGSGGVFETISHFAHLLGALKATGRPAAVTFHSAAALHSMLPPPHVDRHLLTSGGLAAFAQWFFRKARLKRVAQKLDTLWRKRIARFFDGRPGSFRALVHTPRARMDLIHSGFAPEGVSVVPLGYQMRGPEFFRLSRADARAKLAIPADATLLTIFGFIAEYKGHVLAVEALKKLPAGFRLAIIGAPHPGNAIDQTLNEVLKAWDGEDPERLTVTGYVPHETVDLYHAAGDICVAPFLMGNPTASASLTWALTSGKPTVASNIPAFADIHRAANCLALFTPNCAHELAWQIRRLSGDAALKEQLARNGLAFAEANSWERVTARLLDIYQELTGLSGQGIALHLALPLFRAA